MLLHCNNHTLQRDRMLTRSNY